MNLIPSIHYDLVLISISSIDRIRTRISNYLSQAIYYVNAWSG